MGMAATVSEITENMRAEDIVTRERERFSVILDGNPIPSFVIDREHRVVFWNRACEFLTGVPRNDVLGEPVDSTIFYPEPARPILVDVVLEMDLEAMERLYGSKGLARCSFHSEAFEALDELTIAGKKRDVYFHASRLKDSNGEIIGAIETLKDITEHLALQRRLQQSRKMEVAGALAGGIAHNFNNVLTAMIGYTEMAIDDLPEGSPTIKHLVQVLDAGRRAKDLVRRIAAFNQQGKEEKQPVDIRRITEDAIHCLRKTLPSNIKLHRKFISRPAFVLGDPTEIHQVIVDLCSNAAHAMRESGGDLEVSLMAECIDNASLGSDPAPGPYIKLTVTDTGHGMSPKVIERIFDPFFTTKEPGEGTGMGLSFVHGVVKRSGGAIRVVSEPGVGTSFHVFIPRIDHSAEGGESKEEKAYASIPGGTEHILVVDDEEILAGMAKTMLERLGYRVTTRTGSREALEIFRADPGRFDLVLTDHSMPRMTGTELSRELLEIRPDIAIVLCTGFSDLVTPEEAEAMGIGAFVAKPFSRSELARAIRKLLDKNAGRFKHP